MFRMRFILATLSTILSLTLAQSDRIAARGNTNNNNGVATAVMQVSAASQTVTVGKNGAMKFNPESLVVAPGSKIVFEFYPGHNSVVQGSYNSPCSPSSNLAFYSGYVDGDSGPASQVFTVAVDDADPIWFYSSSHCKDGMVGVINPSQNHTLDTYRSGARSSTKTNLPASNNVQGGVLAAPSSTATSALTTSSTAKSEASSGMATLFGTASSLLVILVVGFSCS